jgi:hypothetical protein
MRRDGLLQNIVDVNGVGSQHATTSLQHGALVDTDGRLEIVTHQFRPTFAMALVEQLAARPQITWSFVQRALADVMMCCIQYW